MWTHSIRNSGDWLAVHFPQIAVMPLEWLVALWPSSRTMNDHSLVFSSQDVLWLF